LLALLAPVLAVIVALLLCGLWLRLWYVPRWKAFGFILAFAQAVATWLLVVKFYPH
jgi:hypothetical protein